MRSLGVVAVVAVGWLVALGSLASDAHAALGPAPVALGAADGFAVMAGSTVTSAGVSALTGDLGVSPGTAMTGFPPGTINGTLHAGDATAVQAHADLATAYTDAVGRGPAVPILGDLGGVTLTPGVYAAGAALTLAGTPTLDAQGNPAAVLTPTAVTIENAPTGAGHGEWDFPADTGPASSLAVLIPGDAHAGSYSSTLNFTTAPPAA